MKFSDLPKIGTALHGGTFAGLTTKKNGTHHAVILLPDQGTDLTWKKACNWAQKLEAELPSRPVAALLFANVKEQPRTNWHWTSEPDGASYAWLCHFYDGYQTTAFESSEGAAVAVRLIPVGE